VDRGKGCLLFVVGKLDERMREAMRRAVLEKREEKK
jgi:hypothetical protein